MNIEHCLKMDSHTISKTIYSAVIRSRSPGATLGLNMDFGRSVTSAQRKKRLSFQYKPSKLCDNQKGVNWHHGNDVGPMADGIHPKR